VPRRFYNRIRVRRPLVGVAGWSYDDWVGTIYPAPRSKGFDPLPYLARYLDLIEINSTFYRPPAAKHAEGWVARVERFADFHFTAKLWRRFTHERSEAWTAADVASVVDGLVPLQTWGRLDALLVQFPWSFLDQPLFSRSIKPSARATGRVGYVRVHGRNYRDWFRKGAGRDARYDYLYVPSELEQWAERAKEVARDPEVETVDVVFNSHYRAQAVVNALQFRALLGDPHVEAPPTLAGSYPEELAALGIPVG
jgi:uncharacterized protein YecE (DUF72 family)